MMNILTGWRFTVWEEDIYDKIRREEEQADEGRAAVERELAAGASARKKDGEETQARAGRRGSCAGGGCGSI